MSLMSPDAILAAVDSYSGKMIDLDRSLAADAAQFATGRRTLSVMLRQCGLRPGDKVIMAVTNGPQFIAALAGILESGGSPLLMHSQTPSAEILRTGLRVGATFVLTDVWQEDPAEIPVYRWDHEWASFTWGEIPLAHPDFQETASLPGVPLYPTSGTTGRPKLAARPGPCAVVEAEHYIETTGISESDVILPVTPMSHAYAYGMGMMVPLLTGADIITMSRFQPNLVFKAFTELGVTVFPAVPAMLDVMLFGAGERLRESPRLVFSAGAPLPERVAQNYERLSGHGVRPLFGTTETGGITVGMEEADIGVTGCVGPAMNGVEVETRVTAGNEDLGDGLGSVCVRSSSMMAGYLGRDGVDSSSIQNGWFRTGDLGTIDSRGSVHLKGRETEVINVAGMKVVPSEVEDVIASMPDVAEVKVYAGGIRSGSQIVRAAVVPDHHFSADRIRAYCKERLIYYKCPSVIVEMESLPKTPAGKEILKQLPQ